ncbi:DNA-directed RNA polymerase subunit [Plakobranchus ocellatus]|uniref:DNA-directed RNA polymerase subunit n=1 Tax=Plakobranchus ocellatus TaxID=259542 RepID=A0AAV3XSJ9_9GAST|nr:DNA-directed RNA polymerase subunit [Plakobranchus ocellatus]
MSTNSKATSSSAAKETVLLRKPAPKYSFDGRKLPKNPETTVLEISSGKKHLANFGQDGSSNFQTGQNIRSNSSLTLETKVQQKPVAVVGASFQSNKDFDAGFSKEEHVDTAKIPVSKNQNAYLFKSPSVPISLGSSTACNQNSTLTLNSLSQSNELVNSHSHVDSSRQTQSSPLQQKTSGASIVVPHDAPMSECTQPLSQSEQLQTVREERDKLRTELKAQLQVNAELKRLLVASVGDDLYERVENLCRDRAQLELDIGGFSKKMSEDYENLDKISIQADMWRSKYLASRVMTEELSSAKAYFALQCHDSHSALQQLLNERHELRTNLIESYKVLQQVKNAFDPLNTHKSSSLRSTNVLDLSHACQQLSEAVRFRLLPSNVVINVSADVSSVAWQDSITRAEQLAQEVLSKPVESSGSGSSQAVCGYKPDAIDNLYTRYHPATRYENLTLTCCNRCKGEILLV